MFYEIKNPRCLGCEVLCKCSLLNSHKYTLNYLRTQYRRLPFQQKQKDINVKIDQNTKYVMTRAGGLVT